MHGVGLHKSASCTFSTQCKFFHLNTSTVDRANAAFPKKFLSSASCRDQELHELFRRLVAPQSSLGTEYCRGRPLVQLACKNHSLLCSSNPLRVHYNRLLQISKPQNRRCVRTILPRTLPRSTSKLTVEDRCSVPTLVCNDELVDELCVFTRTRIRCVSMFEKSNLIRKSVPNGSLY